MNLILLGCIVFLVVLQLIKSILDLISSKSLINILKNEAEMRKEEKIFREGHAELTTLKFTGIYEKLIFVEDKQDEIMEGIKDIIYRMPNPPKARVIRGPYGPRKKKAIEHKKTPPDT